MAAQGNTHRLRHLPLSTRAFWAAGVAAAALSLAAAFVGLQTQDANRAAARVPAEEFAARNERILFFEDRAARDVLDFPSLNTLASEYLQRARETGDVGDYARADLASARSLEILPENYGGLVSRAAVKVSQHDFAEALTLANRAVELRPGLPSGYGLQGDALVSLGRYEEAGRSYQKMLALEPDLSSFSRLAGLAFLNGQNDLAEGYWEQAIGSAKVLPVENEAWARVQLSQLYFDRGDLRGAEREAQAALRVYPDYFSGLAHLGAVRAAQGRWDEAIALYTKSQELLPQTQNIIALGDVYEAAGRPDDARRQYDLVQAVDQLYRASGINTDLQISLFYANHDRDLEAALTMAQNNYHASPGIYAADGLAWALYKNGRTAEARPLIEEALRLGTPDAGLHFHAGMIYAASGSADRARRELEKALALNANFSLLQRGLAEQTLAGLKGAGR